MVSGRFSVDGHLILRPTQVHLTAHDADHETAPMLGSKTVKARDGSFTLELAHPVERCLVRASAFNIVRQRSDPAELVAMAA